MRLLLAVIVCFISLIVQGQSFEEFVQQGGELYQEKSYLESAKVYEKAFEMQEGGSSNYYNAACSWALAGDTTNSIKYLHLAAEKGWKNIDHLKKDKDLASLHSVKDWKSVVNKVQNNLNEYEKDFDKPLQSQFE